VKGKPLEVLDAIIYAAYVSILQKPDPKSIIDRNIWNKASYFEANGSIAVSIKRMDGVRMTDPLKHDGV